MRVLHSAHTYLSLTENWIYPQVAMVPDVESRVICTSLTNLEVFPLGGSSPITVGPPPWKSALGFPRLFDSLARRLGWRDALVELKARSWRPQVFHAHFGLRGWESLSLTSRLGVPLVTSFYGYDAWLLPMTYPIWQERYRELFDAGDVFLVEGPAMRQRLLELGCPGSKVRVHRIGVDLSLLPFDAKDFSGCLRIVMVGRFTEKKGLTDGLRACALARSRGVDLRLTIIGDASPDDVIGQQIKEELLVLADSPELAGRVLFTGFLPLEETRDTMKTHNVFMSPSRHALTGDAEGGSPVALTEAMALGLSCIGTRHCDIPELILEGQTGYLCEEGDVGRMADILFTLTAESHRLAELTRAGRRHVEENFALSAQLDKLRAIYSEIEDFAVCDIDDGATAPLTNEPSWIARQEARSRPRSN